MSVTVDLITIFLVQFLVRPIFILPDHTKFHTLSYDDSLVIAVNLKAKENVRTTAIDVTV